VSKRKQGHSRASEGVSSRNPGRGANHELSLDFSPWLIPPLVSPSPPDLVQFEAAPSRGAILTAAPFPPPLPFPTLIFHGASNDRTRLKISFSPLRVFVKALLAVPFAGTPFLAESQTGVFERPHYGLVIVHEDPLLLCFTHS